LSRTDNYKENIRNKPPKKNRSYTQQKALQYKNIAGPQLKLKELRMHLLVIAGFWAFHIVRLELLEKVINRAGT